jgi:hypothetical protein
MNRDDIIRMAREAGDDWEHTLPQDRAFLERFASRVEEHLISQGYRKCAEGQRTTQFCAMVEAIRKEEREACARVAENGNFLHDDSPEARFGKACAAAIRRRGQE